MKAAAEKKTIIWIIVIIVGFALIIWGGWKLVESIGFKRTIEPPVDYIICGYLARCRNNFETVYLGGHCLKCYHKDLVFVPPENYNNTINHVCKYLCEPYCINNRTSGANKK